MNRISVSVAAACVAGAIALGGAPAIAGPLAASPRLVTAHTAAPLDKVVYRHAYRGPVRGYRYRRGPGPAVAAGLAAGVIGAIAGAAAAPAYPYYGGYPYYGPGYYAPACYMTRQAAYDPWGNFVGWRRMRVCQ